MTKEVQQTHIFKERKKFKEKCQEETKSYNKNDDTIKNDLDFFATKNEFCSVDQMLTPLHASFIDEYEYQNVLKDLF